MADGRQQNGEMEHHERKSKQENKRMGRCICACVLMLWMYMCAMTKTKFESLVYADSVLTYWFLNFASNVDM